ncbi:MAG TPA: hypothetical protein VF173_32185 [Thermoanaerobaculia bacterium]|nr:hypothetical protein [Thermoanaerobaculia bacterium]
MRPTLSPSEYMFYHALSKGSPATLNEVIERLVRRPYQRTVTVPYAAALVKGLVAKGYVEGEKVPSGQRGQPASHFTALVPLKDVIRAEAERALQHLAWNDLDALGIIRGVIDEALDARRRGAA